MVWYLIAYAMANSPSKTASMDIYLVQHGEAKSKEDDATRPLTDHGREVVSRVARAARSLDLGVTAIYHSDKLRARQTAEILAGELTPRDGASQVEGLGPTDATNVAKQLVEAAEKSIMVVGHLPHLSHLTSLLLAGDSSLHLVAFKNGGIVCLRRDDSGAWRVGWMLTPELIGVRD